MPIVIVGWLAWLGVVGYVGHKLNSSGTPLRTVCTESKDGSQTCTRTPVKLADNLRDIDIAHLQKVIDQEKKQ